MIVRQYAGFEHSSQEDRPQQETDSDRNQNSNRIDGSSRAEHVAARHGRISEDNSNRWVRDRKCETDRCTKYHGEHIAPCLSLSRTIIAHNGLCGNICEIL